MFKRKMYDYAIEGLARLRFAQPQPKIDERRRSLMYGMDNKNINRIKGATPWRHLYSATIRMSLEF